MRQLESSESAAPLITKMVSGALSGRGSTTFDFSPLEKIALSVLNLGPPSWSRTAAGKYFGAIALDPDIASEIQTELLIQNRIADYDNLQGPFPVIVAGAALGGASAHIAALLGVLFSPSHLYSASPEVAPMMMSIRISGLLERCRNLFWRRILNWPRLVILIPYMMDG